MTHLLLIGGVAALLYGCRFAGFAVSKRPLSPAQEAYLQLAPIAIFAALVVSAFAKNSDLLAAKLAALAIAALVRTQTRHFGLTLAAGFGVYILLRQLVG